jgi:hypothetical protein
MKASTALTIDDAAAALNLAPRTLLRWVKSGRILPIATYAEATDVLDAAATEPPWVTHRLRAFRAENAELASAGEVQ